MFLFMLHNMLARVAYFAPLEEEAGTGALALAGDFLSALITATMVKTTVKTLRDIMMLQVLSKVTSTAERLGNRLTARRGKRGQVSMEK